MFDDPKKALERLQEQLLAAELHEEAEDTNDLLEQIDEVTDAQEEEDLYDEALDTLLNGGHLRHRIDPELDVSGRATGYDADDYEMDTNRYVAPPKERGNGCLAAFVLVLAVVVCAMAVWALWRVLWVMS